jgi:thiamine pyrophosphate-dependent acetolactate synthase large subunit-like protein
LIDRLDAPFAPAPMARGYLPDDHTRCCDKVRTAMLATADVVLLVGANLDWVFRFGAEIARDARRVQIAVNRSQVDTNPAPEVALVGDIRASLQRLLEEIDPGRLEMDSGWREDLERRRREAEGRWDAEARRPDAISLLRLMAEVRQALPRDAVTVLDGNGTLAAGQLLLPSHLPVSRLTPGHDGCMGVGLPFGIAAKLCHPDRPVVVVSGDFAFGLNAMEMETAVRLRVPVVVLVANNDGNGGALTQRALYPQSPDPITMFGRDIHYDRIMTAFGGYGEHVERAEEIGPALKRALASGLPACINVRVDPEAPYPR